MTSFTNAEIVWTDAPMGCSTAMANAAESARAESAEIIARLERERDEALERLRENLVRRDRVNAAEARAETAERNLDATALHLHAFTKHLAAAEAKVAELTGALEEIRHMLLVRPDIADKLRPMLGPAEHAVFERAARALTPSTPGETE